MCFFSTSNTLPVISDWYWSDWREPKRSASVGYWVTYETSTFDLTRAWSWPWISRRKSEIAISQELYLLLIWNEMLASQMDKGWLCDLVLIMINQFNQYMYQNLIERKKTSSMEWKNCFVWKIINFCYDNSTPVAGSYRSSVVRVTGDLHSCGINRLNVEGGIRSLSIIHFLIQCSSPGTHFTKTVWAHNRNLLKIIVALIVIPVM